MCPIVPTFTCGFDRSNFSFAIALLLIFGAAFIPPNSCRTTYRVLLALVAADDLFRDHAGRLSYRAKLHAVKRRGPCVDERMSFTYPNISFKRTMALDHL